MGNLDGWILDATRHWKMIWMGKLTDLLRVNALISREDVGHEWAVLDVLIVTNHMHSIVTWLSGPIADIPGAITLVITLNLSLRRSFDRKACPPTKKDTWHVRISLSPSQTSLLS